MSGRPRYGKPKWVQDGTDFQHVHDDYIDAEVWKMASAKVGGWGWCAYPTHDESDRKVGWSPTAADARESALKALTSSH